MGYLVAALWIVLLAFLLHWFLSGRGARGGGEGGLEPSEREELEHLREEVDRLSAQVERLLEEQSFMVRMLSDRDRAQLRERTPEDG